MRFIFVMLRISWEDTMPQHDLLTKVSTFWEVTDTNWLKRILSQRWKPVNIQLKKLNTELKLLLIASGFVVFFLIVF